MFFILLLIFVLVPVIELNVLIEVAGSIGSWATVGLVLFTAVVGVSLVRSQGLSTLMSVQEKLARGEAPGQEIVEGMMLAAAGVLLLIPGFVTDFIGLVLLTPFTRAPIAAFLYKRMQLRVIANGGFPPGFGAGGGQSPFGQSGPFAGKGPFDQQGNTFDGDFESKDEQPRSHQIEYDNADADRDIDKDDDIIDVEPTQPKDDNKPS
ncbi:MULTISPECIES: FxsA family protein [Shewanella]|uniref:FxsA family protein n=1 Tax=unclassified Shewanella TaxID=196818 RepID=UPI0010C15405|nr:FxsA family protein [Shewanella sp. MEBiC00475]